MQLLSVQNGPFTVHQARHACSAVFPTVPIDASILLPVTEGTGDVRVRVDPTGNQGDVRVRVDPRETCSCPQLQSELH